MYMVTTHYDP